MKYVVTGGCGFIGSHIVEALAGEGHAVTVLDNLSTGHERNLAHIAGDVTFVRGDVRDPEALDRSMAGADGVFHEAALVSVTASVERPRENHDINATGTFNVLEAARAAGVRRVVLASTAAAYGNAPGLPKREAMPPAPESPYAVAKLASEYYLRVFHGLYGLQTVSLRYFNVYGPRQDPSSMYSGVISRFMDLAARGQTPVVYGDGLQTRDFVFVKDVARANLLAMRSGRSGGGEVINVATGNRTNLLDLLAALGRLHGRPVRPEFQPARAGDVRDSCADITLARSLLGYEPRFALDEGLRALAGA